MRSVSKKYKIKIPNNVSVLYFSQKKILHIIGPLTKRSLKIKIKILISSSNRLIEVSPLTLVKVSNSEKKKLKSIQATTKALIKQAILEVSNIFYIKLRLVGIGYKTFESKNFNAKLLLFKLGYSHPIYFKVPDNIKVFCLKPTKFFLYSSFYHEVSQIVSIIRGYKKPEPYKGKGILYDAEKVVLKEGKKI